MQAGLPDPRVAASVDSTYGKNRGAKLADQRIGEAFVSAASLMRLRLRLWAFMLTRDTKRRAYYVVSYCMYGGRESFYKHRYIKHCVASAKEPLRCKCAQVLVPWQLHLLALAVVQGPRCDFLKLPSKHRSRNSKLLGVKRDCDYRPPNQKATSMIFFLNTSVARLM